MVGMLGWFEYKEQLKPFKETEISGSLTCTIHQLKYFEETEFIFKRLKYVQCGNFFFKSESVFNE